MDNERFFRVAFYILVAIAVIALAEAIYLAVFVPLSRKRGINRRLSLLNDGTGAEAALIQIKQDRGILNRRLGQGGLSTLLIQSGLSLTVGRFSAIMALIVAAVFVVLSLVFSVNSVIALAIALLLGVVIPIQFVRIVRNRRGSKFTAQLPDALDVIVRSLRAGHPVPAAIGLVSKEMPDPAGTEFGLTIDEMTFGLDMQNALLNLSHRVAAPELSLLVTAISIQSGAGGNLSELLQNLSKLMRERFQLQRKVRSLSAEGRFSAYGLIILPILIFLSIYIPNPAYYTEAWHDPVYKLSMIGLCIWSVIGNLIMYKMINFKF